MEPSGKQIREAIASLIKTAAPQAVVFPRWVLGYDRAKWPGLLVSPDDDLRPHGWVITKRIIDGEKSKSISGNCYKRDYLFAVMGFHFYSTGDDSLNSEDLFEPETELVTTTLDAQLAALIPKAEIIEPVKFDLDLAPFGGETMHVATGRIIIRPCC